MRRNGILATIGEDGTPQLSNIYYLSDPSTQLVRFSTTIDSHQGPQPSTGPPSSAPCPRGGLLQFRRCRRARPPSPSRAKPEDGAVEKLFEIHAALGAASERRRIRRADGGRSPDGGRAPCGTHLRADPRPLTGAGAEGDSPSFRSESHLPGVLGYATPNQSGSI